MMELLFKLLLKKPPSLYIWIIVAVDNGVDQVWRETGKKGMWNLRSMSLPKNCLFKKMCNSNLYWFWYFDLCLAVHQCGKRKKKKQSILLGENWIRYRKFVHREIRRNSASISHHRRCTRVWFFIGGERIFWRLFENGFWYIWSGVWAFFAVKNRHAGLLSNLLQWNSVVTEYEYIE